jgi:hypothetical protein
VYTVDRLWIAVKITGLWHEKDFIELKLCKNEQRIENNSALGAELESNVRELEPYALECTSETVSDALRKIISANKFHLARSTVLGCGLV